MLGKFGKPIFFFKCALCNLELFLTACVELLSACYSLDQFLYHDPVIDPSIAWVHLKHKHAGIYILKLHMP